MGFERTRGTTCLNRTQARTFYDRFGAKQDQQAFYEDPAVHNLLAFADFGTAKAVFEFGCGTGRFAETLLTAHLPSNARYVGCDLSTTMVGLARARLARFAERAEVQLTEGSAQIPAPAGAFDRFVSNYVLDLLAPQDIVPVLAESHRVLAPEGRLCLVSLTHGTTTSSRLVSWAWARVHRLRPQLVGGCRPLALHDFLPEDRWQILHRQVVVAYAVPSEVVVAQRR